MKIVPMVIIYDKLNTTVKSLNKLQHTVFFRAAEVKDIQSLTLSAITHIHTADTLLQAVSILLGIASSIGNQKVHYMGHSNFIMDFSLDVYFTSGL